MASKSDRLKKRLRDALGALQRHPDLPPEITNDTLAIYTDALADKVISYYAMVGTHIDTDRLRFNIYFGRDIKKHILALYMIVRPEGLTKKGFSIAVMKEGRVFTPQQRSPTVKPSSIPRRVVAKRDATAEAQAQAQAQAEEPPPPPVSPPIPAPAPRSTGPAIRYTFTITVARGDGEAAAMLQMLMRMGTVTLLDNEVA